MKHFGYNMFLLLIALDFISFYKFIVTPDLLNKKWVLIEYLDPINKLNIELTEDDYLHSCRHKYIIEFKKRSKLYIRMNDKMTFIGYYRIKEGEILKINPKISLLLYDRDEYCQVNTMDRVSFREILMSARSYKINGDTLIISYDNTKCNIKGSAIFKLYNIPP